MKKKDETAAAYIHNREAGPYRALAVVCCGEGGGWLL